MMAWTDRHCRYLHRLYSPSMLLFTEMVTTGALLHGQQWHQLDYNAIEHPVALQLGGNDPVALAQCVKEAVRRGYDEINLNVGCPSDRVQQGTFGACLMLQPQLVADCVKAMLDASCVPISVKCRLGVDEHDSDAKLCEFVQTIAATGCERFYIHARKAILGGLTPAQNRSVPPLQPARVKQLKAQLAHLTVVINGGITDTDTVAEHLRWADGVMIGRAAYHQPRLLSVLEQLYFNEKFSLNEMQIVRNYRQYTEAQLQLGVPLRHMTKHLLHSFNGVPGARRFRQILSDAKRLKHNDLSIVDDAIAALHVDHAISA